MHKDTLKQDSKCQERKHCHIHEKHENPREHCHKHGHSHEHGHCHKHEHEHGHSHCHGHSHEHKDEHDHSHNNCHAQNTFEANFSMPKFTGKLLVLRPQSGISGDMLLSGLCKMTNTNNEELQELVQKLKLNIEKMDVRVEKHVLNGITGYKAHIELPHEHAHRNLSDITKIIENSDMSAKAKAYAIKAFTLLAEAEASVHDASINDVHFHEVGALDSIVDTCICAILFDKLNCDHFICGPLPLADGKIKCAHGLISAPAPAVLHLLKNVRVTQSLGQGEMVTPTAISLLKAFDAYFGTWADMILEEHCIVYGSRVIPNIPNGAIFALGKA